MQYEDDEALDNEGKACYHHHGWDTGEETKSNVVYRQQTGITRQKYPNLRFYFLPLICPISYGMMMTMTMTMIHYTNGTDNE